MVATTEVYDPQFSWTAVPGAARYEVEVNPTPDFVPGSKVCCAGTTIATTLSPTFVLKDNVFYWRVRAIDPDGNAGVWNVGPSFTKTFDNVPPVTAPSIKNLRMVDTSDTAQTSPGPAYTRPGADHPVGPGTRRLELPGRRRPVQAGVVQLVGRRSSAGAPSRRRRRGRRSGSGAAASPTPTRTRSRPTGRALVAGHSYCVRVRARSDRDSSGSDVYGDYTYLAGGGQAFTWSGPPTADPCAAPCNPAASDYLLPQTGTSTTRMPFFTWKPLQGRGSYFVLVSKDASFTNIVDYAFTQLPAYAPRGQTVTTYTDEATFYYWAVLPATERERQRRRHRPPEREPAELHQALDAAGRCSRRPRRRRSPASRRSSGRASRPRGTTASRSRRTRASGHARGHRHRLDELHADADISSRHGPLLARPGERREPGRALLVIDRHVPALAARAGAEPDEPDERRPGPHMDLGAGHRRGLVRRVRRPSGRHAQGRQRPPYARPDGDHDDRNRPVPLEGARRVPEGRRRRNVVPGPFSGDMAFTRTIGEPGGAHSELAKDHLLLSWEPKAGTKEYRVQVSQTEDFGMSSRTSAPTTRPMRRR